MQDILDMGIVNLMRYSHYNIKHNENAYEELIHEKAM